MYALPSVLISALFGLVESWWVLLTPLAAAVVGFCFATLGMTFTAFIPVIDL